MVTKSKISSKKEVTKSTSTIVSKKTLIDRISDQIAKTHNLNKNQIEATLTEYLEVSKQALVQGEEIRLAGFYSFKTAITKERAGMNLQTKQKITIPSKRVPKIVFSKDLKEVIANKK